MEKKRKKRYGYLFLSMLILILVIPVAIQRMSAAVLDSAETMGSETAHVYALNEVAVTNQYETVLETLEYQLRPENRTDSYEKLIQQYLKFADEVMGLDDVEAYVSVDGKIYAATYWEGDETFDPLGTQWYQQAIEADGETIYTDAYIDVRLNKTVVTLAKQIKGTEDVVAVDLYPDHQLEQERKQRLPEGTNYFLSDSKGELLKYNLTVKSHEDLQEKFDGIFAGILNGEFDTYDSYIIGVDGVKRGVYYYKLDSGWYSVVTIPYDTLLESYEGAWNVFLGIMGIFVVSVIIFAVADYRTSRKAKVYNEIVGVLGNSYYALYQIDLKSGQYTMLKGSDYVRNRLLQKGEYSQLLDIMKELIRKEDYEEFLNTFSTENMEKLVQKRIRDFGGDFKRLFNGEYRWVHVQMLYDESLQKGTVVLGFRDINEAKEHDLYMLELLKDSLDSVDSMAKSKNMFFSQMSHDMRTPLNGIIGMAKLAKNHTEDADKTAETLSRIGQLGNQLLELINEILDISRMEEGKLELRSESFRIKENLKELAEIFRLQTEETEKQFLTHIDIEDIYIRGDWGKIQQILNNILSNAFKFTADDGKVEMTVTEEKDSNSKYRKYHFRIQDNGAGMSREFLKKLYLPFEREVQFGAANVAGTGLGMTIVHELVHKMGGTIEVESELGEGTEFEIMIPCQISEEQVLPQEEAKEKGGNEEAFLEGKKVLIAEDNMINMEIAQEILKSFGMEPEEAWNGKEAVELFERKPTGYFDIILMDMQMPVMDGCEAAAAIRRSEKKDGGTIPIIAVTANAFAEDIVSTQKAGMNAHVSKPIDFQILKETMEKLLKN